MPLWLLASIGSGSPLHQQRSSPVRGWIVDSDTDRGFSIAYPAGWHRASQSLTPILSDPREIFSVGTYELRPGGQCAQFPSQAIEDLGPADALVTVQEDQALSPQQDATPLARYLRFRPRPSHFGPNSGHGNDESPGCLREPKEFLHRWIPFHDQGRTFYAYVALGSQVQPSVARAAWGILDSLEFDPGPWLPPDPMCGTIDLGQEEYGKRLLPEHGSPGDIVVMAGPTWRTEGGQYAKADRFEAWWNTHIPRTEVPDAAPIRPGPIVHLGSESIRGRCNFSLAFRVPDVAPGRYPITAFTYHQGGYGIDPELWFTVE